MKKIIILSGSGELPNLITEKLKKDKIDFFVISFLNNKPPKFIGQYNHKTINYGKVITELKKLRLNGYSQIILAGSLKRPVLSEIKPDLNSIKLIPKFSKTLFAGGDNNLLKFVLSELENIGFKILKLYNILPDCFFGKGNQTGVKISKNIFKDIDKGKKILSVNSKFDIGQSIILQNGTVIGIEASQGTDNLIKNSSNFIRAKKEAVLVKLLKVKQDLRADLPAIGLQTLKNCKKSGLSGIAYSANRTIFINKDDVIDFCRKNRMFLYGI